MDKRLTHGQQAVVFLCDLLMLFLGLTGTVFCVVTAFGLSFSGISVYTLPLLCALAAAALYSLPWRWVRMVLTLLALCLLALAAWWSREELYLGALVAARQVTGVFAEALSVGGPLDITPYVGTAAIWQEWEAMAQLLRFFTCVLALWLGGIVVRTRSFWFSFWGVFPILMIPLSITVTPGWTPLLLLLSFWGVGLLTRLTRRSDPWGSAKQTLILLPLVLVFLAGMGALFPREDYRQAEWAGRARLQLTDLLARSTHGGATAESGLGLALGGSANVDLGNAGPLDFDGRTVLRVESDTTGHIYLRGFSAATYTGDGWKQLSEAQYQEMTMGWMAAPDGGPHYPGTGNDRPGLAYHPGIGIKLQPLNFPAMADVYLPAVRMVIENVGAPDRFVYTPYQLITSPDRMTGAEFVGDSYLARGVGVWKHILYVRDLATPEHGGRLTGEAAEAERNYRAFVQEHYLQIPEDMKGVIEDLVKDAGLGPLLPNQDHGRIRGEDIHLEYTNAAPELYDMDASADAPALVLGDIVARYLAELADYDPDTPAPQAGEDFVAAFVGGGRGYCMHFASTATLMLRAAGVPARYVTGYVADVTAGERVDVPDYNAHAWVEVYINGYGWQPIEVTPGFSGVFPWENQTAVRPTPTPEPSAAPKPSAAPAPTPPQGQTSQQGGQEEKEGARLQWLLAPAVLALLCAGLVLRRTLAKGRRERTFHGPDTNKAVIDMYAYCTRVLPFAPDTKLDGKMEALGQKARFSQHVLTGEERDQALAYACTLAEMTDKALKWHKKLAFRYLFGLY